MSLLGAELIHRTLWYPLVLGVLVVVAAVVLFIGSVYLLVATNVGARLGFLVVAAALSGFMVILSALWVTTSSPLNTLKGRLPAWKPQQIVKNPHSFKVEKVQDINKTGKEVIPTEAANVKAAADAALVVKQPEPGVELAPDANQFAEFDDVTQYLVLHTWEVGGRKNNVLKLQFTHPPLYGVIELCPVKKVVTPFGLKPPAPTCDPGQEHEFMLLERDLGSIRVPPIVAFFAFLILFALSLLGLHWRERDEQARAAAATNPAPVPEPANA